jgi:hypothetical protein
MEKHAMPGQIVQISKVSWSFDLFGQFVQFKNYHFLNFIFKSHKLNRTARKFGWIYHKFCFSKESPKIRNVELNLQS